MTTVMSSPFAGAEMITLLAPAVMCLRASSAFVKRPVDSSTRSTPSVPHGRSAGSLCEKTSISSPSIVMLAAPPRYLALENAVHGIVLEQVRERLRVGQIVHRYEIEVRDPLLLRRAHDLAADASESVDPDFDGHRSDCS